MELIQIVLTACSVIVCTRSQGFQSQNPYIYQQTHGNIDGSRVYFADNIPSSTTPAVISDSAKEASREDINYSGQVKPVTPEGVQASPLNVPSFRVQQTAKNYPSNRAFAFQNANRPILQLQPPIRDESYQTSSEELLHQFRLGVEEQDQHQNASGQELGSLAVTNFALSLFKNVDQTPGKNTVVSPYSIANLLALVEQGAVEESLQQLAQALQMSPQVAALTFRAFTTDIQKRHASGNILKVANNIFLSHDFGLNPMFKSSAINNFGSEVTPTSFANPDDAVRRINYWVAAKTNQNIKEILSADKVSENVQLILVNAVYFKGLWQTPFKSEYTLPGPFLLSSQATTNVPTMRMRKHFKVGYDRRLDARVLILPFENNQYSLLVILPSQKSSVDAVLSKINDSYLDEYQRKLRAKEVELSLPKFTVKTDTNLTPVFLKMGITKIFQPASGLSGIGLNSNSPPQVSSAAHSAMLAIDERGGTGAAATAAVAVALSNDDSTVEFHVDRPFIAVLWDNQAKLPLFLARIEDPTQI